jgi:serine/threonine-protein kinase
VSTEPRLITRAGRRSASESRVRTVGLPEDLLRDSGRRLRFIAAIYAAGTIIADGSVFLFDPVRRSDYAYFFGWGPPAIGITVAMLVVVLASNPKIAPAALMNIGLVFEVVVSYVIAAATYWGAYRGLAHEPAHLTIFGLSYVAPWIMFFTIVSPNEPRKALAAAMAAGTSVPVMLLLTIRYGGTSIALTPSLVANTMVVPFVLIVFTAWVGARVVYRMGTDVSRAREMGSYRLTERVGGGGMGEVWKARHRMLVRPAAIKLIRPDALGSGDADSAKTLQQRFEREAQATALLQSPHTVDIYDFGVTADGTFYYVMELLHGFDFERLVQRFGPVPPERAIFLLRQVCDSLAEAHGQQLIHRDIKPANLYVCCRGRQHDFAKVLDFGLVKPQWSSAASDVKLTAPEFTKGTPAYMAPEQAGGDPLDARSDIYALGCVAFWLVTGQLVFPGGSAIEQMAEHLHAAPPRPSARTENTIPSALEDVILACLAKDPRDRPQNAEALDAFLAGAEPEAGWTSERAAEWWRLHQPDHEAMLEETSQRVHVL